MNRAPPPNATEFTFAKMSSAGMRGVLTNRSVTHYLSVKIYSARSATSARLRASFGMFGCGSSKRIASLFAPNSGVLAIEANGGA